MTHTEAKLDAAAAAIVELSVAVRDLGPDDTQRLAAQALAALGQDAVAALIIAAALIRIDQPMDLWWQKPAAQQPAWTNPPRPEVPEYWEPAGGWRPVTPQEGRDNLRALCDAYGITYDPNVHTPIVQLAASA